MRRRLVTLLVPLLLLAAGAPAVGDASTASTASAASAVAPLPVGTHVDYQLGGARDVPRTVGIVVRDRRAEPIGRYDVCYVNGFQTQPDETAFWRRHADLVLHSGGRPVVDSAWGEWLLDIRSATKRAALARIVGAWIRGCAARGFEAVELDNLDSFTRSRRLLTASQTIAYARLLVDAAHEAGLAVGQKNLGAWDGRRVGFDFAVAEECGRYRECVDYVRHYGRRVLAIEYRATDFAWTCRHYGPGLPVELRDLDLTPGGVHRWC